MNKLNVGDYVRDHINGIGEIIKCYDYELEIAFKKARVKTTVSSYFEFGLNKAEKKLIDLIEVGDYVNGYKIVKIFTNRYNGNKVLIAVQKEFEYEYSDDINDYMCDDSIHIYNENIKSIVTHEQFESEEYKV